jgi:hypothetical protein
LTPTSATNFANRKSFLSNSFGKLKSLIPKRAASRS